MKKFIKKCIPAVLTATLLCSTALAAEVSHTVKYDYMNNTVTISGSVDDKTTYASLQILAEGKSFEDLANDPTDSDLVLYRYQTDIADGEFLFTVEYDITSPGAYAAKLVTNGGDTPAEFDVMLVDGAEFSSVLSELKGFADNDDFSGFKNCIETKGDALGFDTVLYSALKDANAILPYMNYISTQTLDPNKSNEVIADFNSFVLMAALEEGKVSNISDYIENASVVGSQVAADYISLADTTGEQEYITSKMTGKKIESFEDFEKALKEALILGEVRYASGYGGIKSILSKYGSVIGITDTASTDVYKAMSGVDYKDGVALEKAYRELKKETPQGGGSLGGFGGSTGGGGGSSNKTPTYMNSTYPTDSQTETPKKVYSYFNDIDGVEWATEAILALADMNIINGKSEGYFKPNDFITREEFAKIIVCALGYQDEEYSGNVFTDASGDEWFVPYINIAYDKGLVKGIGDGKFGVGELISRQDMMVMLCNAFKTAGVTIPNGVLTFDDSDIIADYAKDAVASLYTMGIINGVSETEFDPLGNATRAQAAKVVYGFLQHLQ